MIGSLRQNWRHTWAAVWSRMDESAKSPADLYARLYRAARHYLAQPPDAVKEIDIKNDREAGRAFFRSLRSEDFNGEQAIVAFLEEAYADLATLNDGSAVFFRDKCREFLSTYNLPYRIANEFEIRLKPIGPISVLYEELQRVNSQDGHLQKLFDDYEKLFQMYCSMRDELLLRKCLDAFANYYDGLVRHTLDDPASKAKFEALAKQVKTWPHGGVRSAVVNLYGFCSDYPGMRHGGNPQGELRTLRELDAAALCAFFLGFSGYLTDDIHESELIEA